MTHPPGAHRSRVSACIQYRPISPSALVAPLVRAIHARDQSLCILQVEQRSEMLELLSRERFGEAVCRHASCGHVGDLKIPFRMLLASPEMMNVDVPEPGADSPALSDYEADRLLVIAEDHPGFAKFQRDVVEEPFER